MKDKFGMAASIKKIARRKAIAFPPGIYLPLKNPVRLRVELLRIRGDEDLDLLLLLGAGKGLEALGDEVV